MLLKHRRQAELQKFRESFDFLLKKFYAICILIFIWLKWEKYIKNCMKVELKCEYDYIRVSCNFHAISI